MADQRIHLFKVFRGSSVAKAKKYLSCSFISKSSSTDDLSLKRPQAKLESNDGRKLCTNKSDNSQLLNHPLIDNETTAGAVSSEGTGNTVLSSAPKEESLRFIYHEEDSEEEEANQRQAHFKEMKIQESSIEIEEPSSWMDLQKISPVFNRPIQYPSQNLNQERKIIEEERLKLEIQKRELQSKRKQIENLMNEFHRLKDSCERIERSPSPRMIVTQFQGQRPRKRLEKRNISSTRYTCFDDEENLDPKAKQQKLERSIQLMQKSQQQAKKQKARKIILLETLWINLIKNSNQIRNRNNILAKGAFCIMKNLYRINKFIELIDSAVCVPNLMALGQAFVRIKKTPLCQIQTPAIQRNPIVKFIKCQRKENLCHTDRYYGNDPSYSRISSYEPMKQIELLTESLDSEKWKNRGGLRQIDSIIKDEMNKARHGRTQRGKSIQQDEQKTSRQTPHRVTRIQVRGQRVENFNPKKSSTKLPTTCNPFGSSSGRIHLRQISTVLKPENRRVIPR